MRKSAASVLLAFLAFAVSASPQEKSDKFAVFVTGLDDAAPVTQSLIKKLNESRPFEAVTKEDPSKVAVLISCMSRKQTDPFVCMYVSHYNGATFKTFLGGGLFLSASADAVASNFLGSIAQDIVERFDSTNTDNLRGALESCLLLTDAKCNVPGPLQKEFGAKQLTLGQYLLKKHQ
jgi:zinc transporter ZupT